MNRIVALIALFSLFAAPLAYAQSESDTTGAPPSLTEQAPPTVPTDEALSGAAPAPSDPASAAADAQTVQTTAEVQNGADASALAQTADPNAIVDASSTIAVIEATSTDPAPIVPVAEDPAPAESAPLEIPIEPAPELTIAATLATTEATSTESFDIALHAKELNASLEPDYVFELSGKAIPTTKTEGKTKTVESDPVKATVGSEGDVTISGACDTPYYVVLLFRHQDDYDRDPASYIVNRAYPCENGAYSYTIDRLPSKIQNGTYYLLIGEQGETGSWKPASALTEITINRSN